MAEHCFFYGRKFFINDHGYWRSTDRSGEYLHKLIWENTHGKVPEGYEIHHADFNPLNNNLDNLQCLTKSEHRKLHAQHRNTKPKNYNQATVCVQCGKVFMASRSDAKFCSANCCVKWRYHQGRCHTQRVCAHCGKVFQAVNPRTKYCSLQCAAAGNGTTKLTDQQRAQIRAEYISGSSEFSSRALAKKYGISHKTVLKIVHEK